MPHITLKMYQGRTEEQKKAATEALTKALQESLGCTEDHISISIYDYDPKEWGEKVFYPEIMKDEEHLYKRPEYKPL
ncbi:MAG: 4-oxalocrotonate tautomerase [Ruminococcaceae bacterium]|nr:4-oxalocrotonate tautomerase [Oscillospiraceae bacterium]